MSITISHAETPLGRPAPLNSRRFRPIRNVYHRKTKNIAPGLAPHRCRSRSRQDSGSRQVLAAFGETPGDQERPKRRAMAISLPGTFIQDVPARNLGLVVHERRLGQRTRIPGITPLSAPVLPVAASARLFRFWERWHAPLAFSDPNHVFANCRAFGPTAPQSMIDKPKYLQSPESAHLRKRRRF
jgi:hypothetical protein